MMYSTASSTLLFALPEGFSGLAGLLAVLGIYLVLSWLVCVAAAFCRVKQIQFRVGLLSMGASMLVAFLLVGLCRMLLPDLAASFTPGGLFLVSALAGALVCSVPLIQYFWDVSYGRGVTVIGGAIAILLGSIVMIHLLLYPAETLPARFAVPLFQEHQPGLIE